MGVACRGGSQGIAGGSSLRHAKEDFTLKQHGSLIPCIMNNGIRFSPVLMRIAASRLEPRRQTETHRLQVPLVHLRRGKIEPVSMSR